MYTSESSDCDSDEEYNFKKCFVVELPANFDPNKTPSTGEEYLQYVMYESRKCKKVASVNVDSEKFAENQTIWINKEDTVAVPTSMLPTRQWQEDIIKEFTDYRDYLASITPKTPHSQNAQYSHWKKQMDVEYPHSSVITDFSCCDQSEMLKEIIIKLENIKSGNSVDNLLGCWIYNILSTLKKPLVSEQYILLRDLSRKCNIIRSKLVSTASSNLYTPLNVFICIVARYFGQLDLTDN